MKEFTICFVYYFCTSPGPDPEEPVPETAMDAAHAYMLEAVKDNKTLEARLEAFVPRWRVGLPPSQREAVSVLATAPIAKVTIPPRLRATLEKEMVEILEWGDDGLTDDELMEDMMDLAED